MDKLKKNLIPSLIFLSLLCLWEWYSRTNEQLFLILPPPSAIMVQIFAKYDRFLFHASVTLKEMLGGFVLAFLIAFPVAWSMVRFISVCHVMQPILIIIQCIPMFALAPIMVFWFDWSYTAIVIPTALMIFFPLTMNMYQGFKSTPEAMLDYFRVHKATPWQTFYKLKLPWAMPHLFAGFRISAAIAGIGAVAGEWAGGQEGLGVLMIESRRGADLEMTFGAFFCLTIMSLVLYGLITTLEKWRVPAKKYAGLLSLLVIFCLTSCSNDTEKTHRLLLDWLPNPNHVPIYAGLEKGIFEKHGIPLEVLKIQDPADSMPFVVAGKTDFAVFYMTDTVRAQASGIPVEVVGVIIDEPLNAFIYRKDSGIKSKEDLNGRTIGYCIDGYNTRMMQRVFLENEITPKVVHNVSFDLVSTLGSGQVDAIVDAYWNIECEHLRSYGIQTDYLKFSAFGVPDYYELIVIAKEGMQKNHPEKVEQLQVALQESLDYARKHPEEAFEAYRKQNPDKSQKTLAWEKLAWLKTVPVLAKSQVIDKDIWDNYTRWVTGSD